MKIAFLLLHEQFRPDFFILKYQTRESPADYVQALFEKVAATKAISTAVAFAVTPGISTELSVTLPVTAANPPRKNAFLEWTSENSNAGAMKYLGMNIPPRESRPR
jgi:hypothetical protein